MSTVGYFELVSAYKDSGLPLPERKTDGSAGYDFVVAEDIVVPSFETLFNKMAVAGKQQFDPADIFNVFFDPTKVDKKYDMKPKTLDEMAELTKITNARPTLVPTGVKCYLPKDHYLELTVRSSCPLKYWLVLANGVGIIDSDYWNNSSNEGHIYFQIINYSPYDILLKRGDIIGQGIVKPYCLTLNDNATATRTGGFGSTSK